MSACVRYRTYVVNVGTVVTFAWRAVSTFLDPGTVVKIRLVGGFHDLALLDDFSPAQVRALTHENTAAGGTDLSA